MSNLVDRYLLFRIRTKRDPEAFAKIYDRYVKALYRFNLLKLPSKEDAQDATAETFTKAWNYLLQHEDVTYVRALLYQIARNIVADFYRNRPSARGIEIVSVTYGPDSTSNLDDGQLDDHGREREVIEARTEVVLILKQLEKLKEDYRDVVTLRLVDGLSFSDIATILEKKTGHVRVIYHRAIKTLNT